MTAALRRVALDQLDRALAAMRDSDGDLHERVHDARKRCKKLRGLIRLVRPAFPDYKAENGHLRDAARILSDFRDRGAVIETLDKLNASRGDEIDPGHLSQIRDVLVARRDEAAAAPDLTERQADFIDALSRARARAAGWKQKKDGVKAFGPGLEKTYARARDAGRRAARSGALEDLHEWRKRLKYHGYHLRLLKRSFPEMTGPQIDAVGRLGEMIGDHRDLATLRELMTDETLPQAPRAALSALAGDEQARLAAGAMPLGEKLLAEKPGALVKRWGAWWTLWRGC